MSFTLPLIDFGRAFDINSVALNDAKAELSGKSRNRSLEITLGHQDVRPSATIPLPENIEFSKYVSIAMDITNLGSKSISIEAQCYSEKDQSLTYADGALFYYRGMLVLNPGETDTMIIFLSRRMEDVPDYIGRNFQGMFGLPGGFLRRRVNIDDLNLMSHISIFKQKTSDDWKVAVSNVRILGQLGFPDEETLETKFFPFIDKFGQYMHSTWPHKVKSADDLKRQKLEEEQDLAAHPGPTNWDQYGGWATGPTLKATGHFRVEKYNGKWWFVDPEGKLFWMHGVTGASIGRLDRDAGASMGMFARTETRVKYFTELPPNGDFYSANMLLKYEGSQNIREEATNILFKRMRSWGINSAGSGTPYALFIASPLGIFGHLAEDFDAVTFKKKFREIMSKNPMLEKSKNDPWCIGIFIDNECTWPETNQETVIPLYFKTVREVFNEFAPNKLYLGCRINSPNFNRVAFESLAKYSDVISINHYDYNFSDFKETEGLDIPVMVSEFHFGALDRGMPHASLRSASSQKQRARIYQHYVNQALASDYIIGTQWFMYSDQPYTSMMGGGENYQIGFVDVCDRPYQEMVDVLREISSGMYDYRLYTNMKMMVDAY
ncbi:MAG: hypothetical protein LBR13_00865 [Dysgonamonadaceae bacterium]|jgi:hypothetical protein|nr:hypothetical protein [Dysgonamonadaceae bacterium]